MVAKVIVAGTTLMLMLGACSAPPSPTPSDHRVAATPSPTPLVLGLREPNGIPVDVALSIAKKHVGPAATFTFAWAGINGTGSQAPPDELVWRIHFEATIVICPPTALPCFSPRPGYTTVVLDYRTGAFIESGTFSPRTSSSNY
jgi:hypothetical protein